MTDVVVPGVGTLKFPDGMSQEAMASAIRKNFPQIHGPQAQSGPAPAFNTSPMPIGNVGPAPENPQAMQQLYQQTAADASQAQTGSFLDRMNARFKPGELAPQLAMLSTALVPGSTVPALAIQSAIAGGTSLLGNIAKQQTSSQPVDVASAAKSGAGVAVGNFVSGMALKGLGLAAKKIFSSPLDEGQQAAAQFAREQGAPFPLSSAAPETPAGKIQQGSRALLAGDIKTQLDANRVTAYLNNTVGQMTEKGQVFDDAARQGQQFFANIVNPNKAGTTEAWNAAKEALGADNVIPANAALEAAAKARDALKGAGAQAGQKGDEFYTLLDNFVNSGSDKTVRQLDIFSSKLIKAGFKGPTAQLAREVHDAVNADVVAQATNLGLDDVAKTFTEGLEKRALYRKLSQIPQMERLAGELGTGNRGDLKGTFDWMNTLFTKGNGKALAILRDAQPDLYHDLADAWLAKQIDNASGFSQGGIGRQVDGTKLRAWFEQNQDKIKLVFGSDQAKALDNFSLYARYMTGAAKRSSKGLDPTNMMLRAGSEIASTLYKPGIVIAGEPAAFVLARGLADPNSALFKAFTQGFSPATRSFVVKSAGLAGQEAARAQSER